MSITVTTAVWCEHKGCEASNKLGSGDKAEPRIARKAANQYSDVTKHLQ